MSIASFEELCSGFCEIAGFAPPVLTPNDRGTLAFSVRLKGVVVTALEPDHARGESAILIAEFGALRQDQELNGMLALLDANLFMMDVDAPRFCRNPRNGEIILQWTCPLWDVSPTEVYRRITQMVDVAVLWREDHLLGSQETSPASWNTTAAPAARDSELAAAGAADFQALYRDICAALGHSAPALRGTVDDCTFPLRMAQLGADVTVAHSPSRRPGVAFIGVRFGAPAQDALPDRVAELMQANFTMMMDRQGATFCRDPWSGELMLVYGCPIAGADVQQFLTQVAGLALLASQWQDNTGDRA
jgi:hypothetical protein